MTFGFLLVSVANVQGIPTVERAVISQDKGTYNLLVEGLVAPFMFFLVYLFAGPYSVLFKSEGIYNL